MLKSLELTNFRKHRNSKFTFGDGLTVIRGANEAGKTTIGKGVLYALFGTTALDEPLSEVVTTGEPESSLKADLVFCIDGVDYRIVRSKSGAELQVGDRVVTGQRDTRQAVENILGCTADVACLLMFADQNAVRGVIAEGGSAANSLVEKLANLDVIENLIERIQAQLPSGNTKAVDLQIQTLRARVSEVPAMPSKDEVVALTAEISEISEKIDLSERRMPADQEVVKAKARVEAKNRSTVEISRLQALEAQISATLAKPVTPPFDFTMLEQARALEASSAEQTRRLQAYKTTFPTTEDTWEGSVESAQEFLADSEKTYAEQQALAAYLKTKAAVAASKVINEKSCAFCKKDLSDVPEVARLNAELSTEVSTLIVAATAALEKAAGAKQEAAQVRSILRATEKCQQLAGEYWALDFSVLPPKASWIGEPPEAVKPSNLKALEKAWQDYQSELAKRDLLQQQLADIAYPELVDTADAEEVLKLQETVADELKVLKASLATARLNLVSAEAKYTSALQARNSILERNELDAKAAEQLEESRREMLKHNELIKKLRAARPEIAAKMWSIVLGTVSNYFTKGRGENSIVTRTADGFKVNGKSIVSLSGSTKDMLGLAIRMALCKVFMPNVPFLFLDESFAGADEDRELNGVGLLASAGFSQTLLVTHSDIPGTLADNVITL